MSKRPVSAPDSDEVLSAELQTVFGENVRAARLKAGISQVELSRRSGIGQKEISLIENGQLNVTIRTMTRIARVLGATVGHMLFPASEYLKKP